MNSLNLKKILGVFLIASCLIVTPVKKAEAGVVIGTIGLALVPEYGPEATIVPMTIAGISAGLGVVIIRLTTSIAGTVGGSLLIALDANTNLSQSVLVQTFARSYPFINNQQTLNELAKTLKEKAPKTIEAYQKIEVSLSENEVRDALESSDLTEEEIQVVIQELK